jgi:hypothetical protein
MGTALSHIGTFHNNPPRQGQVSTSRDLHVHPSAHILLVNHAKALTVTSFHNSYCEGNLSLFRHCFKPYKNLSGINLN